jgi:hypothetical protein
MLFATSSEFGNGVVTNADKIYAQYPRFHVISPQLEFLEKQGETSSYVHTLPIYSSQKLLSLMPLKKSAFNHYKNIIPSLLRIT